MVYQTSHISASLVNTTTAEMPSSKGVVNQQIDESTYVIRIPSGDVTVKVPKSSLIPGESVSISFQGDDVLIDRLDISFETFEKLGDLIELRLGTKIDDLVTMLKDLRSSLSGELVDPELLRRLDMAIQSLEKREADIASLLQIINQIKAEVVSKFNTAHQNSAQEALNQIAKVLSFLSEKAAVTGRENISVSQSQVIKLSTAPQHSFRYVNNGNEALDLLLRYSTKLDVGTERFLKAFTDKPLFIRFYESVLGEKKAFIMSREQALVEIEHLLHSEMKSAVMKQLNPSIIADTIIQRGNLALSQLFNIDNLIASISTDENTPLIKEDARNLTLPQLLAIALDARNGNLPDFQTALTRVGSRIPVLVQDIIELINKSSDDFKLVDLRKIIFESMSLMNIDKREDFLPAIFRNMGYSLEHDMNMAAHGSAEGLQKDSPSLKLAMLLILGYLNSALDEKSAGGKTGAEEEAVYKNLLSEETQLKTPKTAKQFMQETGGPGRETAPYQRVSAEMIRQQVETALNHLESLQMLAKPTIGTDGEQQVLILPVNIGDEWTELRVKFIKEHHGKGKGKKARHVSVMLNIDLTSLGEVTAFMEYILRNIFNVSLTFDNERAKKWFQKNRKDFIEALTGLGFKTVHLSIQNKNSKKEKKEFLIQKPIGRKADFDVLG